MSSLIAALVICLCLLANFLVGAFMQLPTFSSTRLSCKNTALNGGYGIATNYSWTEEPFEIEVTVQVPPETRAKDIHFKATPTSIDLTLDGQTLLDGNRNMRGRISLDGTFWVISDCEDDDSESRTVTVTIEKNTVTPKDDFEVVDYDWRGVYPDDDEEVSERKYEEAEELNVREYAASLGVDIDNINMSMVDKTMFSSGLNVTRSTMDELSKSGYVQEVTQQNDGSEYTINQDGEVMPFSRLGDTVDNDEVREAINQDAKIPFLDTNSPWHNAVPVEDIKDDGGVETNGAVTSTAEQTIDSQDSKQVEEASAGPTKRQERESDPIDRLTVNRLKEILRTQGLKVRGSKKELQDRLREHVGTMMTEDER